MIPPVILPETFPWPAIINGDAVTVQPDLRGLRSREEYANPGFRAFDKWVDSDRRSLLLGNTVELSRCDMQKA